MGEGSGIYGETTTVTVAAVKRPEPTSGGDETKEQRDTSVYDGLRLDSD